MKVTTITTSRGYLPVVVRYTCMECKKAVEETMYVPHKGVTAAQGYQTTGDTAHAIMIASAEERLKKSIQGLKDGSATLMTKRRIEVPLGRELTADTVDANTMPFFKCPYCNTQQVNEAMLKKHTLRTNSTVFLMSGLTLAITVIWAILLSKSNTGQQAGIYTGICAVAEVVMLILGIGMDKRLNRKAIKAPALMKKRYHAVINNAIDVDFSEYDLGVVRVGSGDDTSAAAQM